MSILLTNIKQIAGVRESSEPLRGAALAELPVLENAWLLTEGESIADFGLMNAMPEQVKTFSGERLDCSGRIVLPAWCDSHTHLVFAGSRDNELADKIRGLSYAEINARGGGILQTVRAVQDMAEDELFDLSLRRLQAVARLGTGAIEIKSGYGLTVEAELKMLRVIKRLKAVSPVLIKSSFLGAHTYPLAFREQHEAYLDIIVHEMLPQIAAEGLADYIDVFCEKGFFSVAETELIVKAGLRYGLKPKLHTNQLNSIGGIAAGIRNAAVSLDHLETISGDDLALLSATEWKGICTLLPTAAMFLNLPQGPARQLINAGAALAIASDYNPGSSPSGNMNLVLALACLQARLLPAEAINAATLNGAVAMQTETRTGSITRGKLAQLIVTRPVPSPGYLAYAFGENHIDKVILRGAFFDK